MTALAAAPPILFIIGPGRSGTTIVLHAVAAMDAVTAVPRLAGRMPAATRLASVLARTGAGPRAWTQPSSEATALFTEAGMTQDLQIRKGRSLRPGDEAELHLDRLARRLDQVRRARRASTVAVKNTASCARIPLLAHAFPGATFLHVLRPPSAVVRSLLAVDFWPEMTLWWDGRTTVEYAHEEGIPQEQVAARHWARQVRTVLTDLAGLPESRRHTMRYANFTANPVEELRGLQQLGIPMTAPSELAARINRLGIRPSSQSEQVPDEVRAAVVAECSDVAEAAEVAL